MKVGIIGAGFTGLAAGFYLAKQGYEVTILEKDKNAGGLAIGYQEKEWGWTLEQHYHHWFTNDDFILNLAKEINHKVVIKTPFTDWYVNGKIYRFDSVKAALNFPLLSPVERVRQLAALAFLRFNPFWKTLEKYKTNKVMPRLMGKKAYDMLWRSIMTNKFGRFADEVSLAWFWARIKKRTQSLAYPEGGFLSFANHLVKEIEKLGGKIVFDADVLEINSKNTPSVSYKLKSGKRKAQDFDFIIVTLPTFLFLKLAPSLPKNYKDKFVPLKGLGATNLLLRLKKPFFKTNTYWLSVADTSSPIMAIVEHTNFMDKKHYNNEHLVYLGNYLPQDDPRFLMEKHEKLKLFDPFLKKINPDYYKNLIDVSLFKAPFAQPIISTYYSKHVPPMTTPLKNVYLANIQQVYPWDRGTNYAVELGLKAAELISKK